MLEISHFLFNSFTFGSFRVIELRCSSTRFSVFHTIMIQALYYGIAFYSSYRSDESHTGSKEWLSIRGMEEASRRDSRTMELYKCQRPKESHARGLVLLTAR